MQKHIIIGILILFFCFDTKSQSPSEIFNEKISEFFQNYSAEKIYLQSDKDVYFTNDTLWYKISITNAHNNKLVNGYRNIYVELVNESNQCVLRNLVAGINGVTHCDITLNKDQIKPGKYQLRTYTQYQRNFGCDFYYRKNILIKELYSNQFLYQQKQDSVHVVSQQSNSPDIDFQLLPEGGYLSLGVKSTLCFKALNSNGMSINVNGWLKDSDDKPITEFKTLHAGMGKMSFVPQENKDYFITLNECPNFKMKVPKAQHKVKMDISVFKDSIYSILITDLDAANEEKLYYLLSTAHGVNTLFCPIKMQSFQTSINIKKLMFEMGVNRIILTDEDMNPITERLIFVNRNEPIDFNIEVEEKRYEAREKIDFSVKSSNNLKPLETNISISAVNVNQNIKLEEYEQTLQSYLLLDSELKGHIENPSYYFKDDSASTKEKLDLLLTTQGWSNYIWSRFDTVYPQIEHKKEFGLELSGRVKRLFGKKGVKEGKVTILMKNDDGFYYYSQIETGENGTFKFPGMVFPDTVSTYFQGENKFERRSTEIVDLKTFKDMPNDHKEFMDFATPDEKLQQEFNHLAYQRMLEDKAYNPQKYEHLLDEVTVVRNKSDIQTVNDGHSRMYGVADQVFKIDENSQNFNDVWDIISQAAGVIVTGNSVSIRRQGEPLFLLDGNAVDATVFDAIQVEEIDKVEILKNASNLAVFGVRGGNGAIAVYTKRGKIFYKDVHRNGILTENLRGYSLSRQFYNPNYKVNNTKQTDHRATLYWNPNANIDSTGVANFSFYNSDDETPILIKVEGLGVNGETGVGYKIINKRGE